MDGTIDLPDDPAACRALVEQLQRENNERQRVLDATAASYEELRAEYDALKEELAMYGRFGKPNSAGIWLPIPRHLRGDVGNGGAYGRLCDSQLVFVADQPRNQPIRDLANGKFDTMPSINPSVISLTKARGSSASFSL